MKKPTNYNKVLKILEELHSLYPSFNIGRHLSTALEEYRDIWGVPDSEVLYALEKYKATLEYNNVPRETDEEELEKIINDGLSLNIEYED